jgi:hypothetical protein
MLKLRDWVDINKIDWNGLSLNTNAIDLLKENKDNINWNFLSENKNAINILEENKNKINWNWLSGNPNAIELLNINQKKFIGIGYPLIQVLLTY